MLSFTKFSTYLFSLFLWGVIPFAAAESQVQLLAKTVVEEKALTFAKGSATRFGISVNGRSHQQTAILSYRGYQYTTYFNAKRQVCIARRKLPAGEWQVIEFQDHRFETNDSHNTSVIGICDKDGTIHMAFDHHATRLNYRVSKTGAAHQPGSTTWNRDLFGNKQHSLGKLATTERVTYPRFFSAPNGNLMLYYRSVTSANGDGMIEEYDGEKQAWTPGLGKFISRDTGVLRVKGKTSHFRCPYINSISYVGSRLHASWTWRDRFEKTLAQNNHSLCYAYSDDHGRTWQNTQGEVIGVTGEQPIHLDSQGLVVARIPINSRLSNQTTHYAFPDGSIHIVVFHRSKNSNARRYQHYWRSKEGVWKKQELPFSGNRPKLLMNKEREMILVFSDDERLHLAKGVPNSAQTSWTWQQLALPKKQTIAADAIPDLERWRSEQILSLYLQEEPSVTKRTRSSKVIDGRPSALIVADYRIH
jgi:hypothetical protein